MISEKQKRDTYKKAFGKEFDDERRKQHPLPIDIAYKVAIHKLTTDANKKASQISLDTMDGFYS